MYVPEMVVVCPGAIVTVRQGGAMMLEGSPAQVAQKIVDVLRQNAPAKG